LALCKGRAQNFEVQELHCHTEACQHALDVPARRLGIEEVALREAGGLGLLECSFQHPDVVAINAQAELAL